MKSHIQKAIFFLLLAATVTCVFGQTEWTIQNSGTSEVLQSVIWTGSRLVVVGYGGTILTSTDGISWTSHNSDTSMQLFKVMSAESLLVAIGLGPIITSSDGITWTIRNVDWDSRDWLHDIIYTVDQFVIVGGSYQSDTRGTIILTSPDGITWTYQSASVDSFRVHLYSVAWNGNQLVAVGVGATILTSPDGITWTRQYAQEGSDFGFWDVTWTGDQFVAVGYDSREPKQGSIYTSPDGTTWTCQNSSSTIYEIAWCGNLLLATGDKGLLLTSPDGMEWTKQAVDTSIILNSIIWTGNCFVAVGTDGTILTSPEGTTWTSRSSGTEEYLISVVMANNLLVAVGYSGTIITSPVDNVPVVHSLNNLDIEELTIKSTPNLLTIVLPVSLRGSSFSIYSLAGKKMLESRDVKAAGKFTISTGSLAPGVYQFIIDHKGRKLARSFVVNR